MFIIYFGYAIQEAAQKERRNRAEFVTARSFDRKSREYLEVFVESLTSRIRDHLHCVRHL